MRNLSSTRARAVVLTATVAAGMAGDAAAVVTTWNNATGNGQWSDPANWSHGVPTPADEAVLQAAGTVTLPTSPPATAARLSTSTALPQQTRRLASGRLVAAEVTSSPDPDSLVISSDVGAAGASLRLSFLTVDGTIGDGAGGGSFALIATQTKLRGNSTHVGDTLLGFNSVVEAGGAFASSARVVAAGTTTFNASAAFPNLDVLPDAGELRLVGSRTSFNAGSVGIVTERTGALVVDASGSHLNLNGPASGSFVLTGQSLARVPGGVLQLGASPSARLRLLSSPTASNGAAPTDRAVLGWGSGSVSDGAASRASFLTYDAGADPTDPDDDVGLRPLDWSGEYATAVAGGGNVRLTGAHAIATDATVRSLNVAEGSLQISGARLSVQSGVILQGATAAHVGGMGSLALPADATILTFGPGARHTIDVPVQADTLTKGGDGELVLGRPNVIPGAVYVSGGTLTSRAAGALGSGTVTIADGTLHVEGESQTVEHVRRAGAYNATYGNLNVSFGGVGGATVSAAPGATLTLGHVHGQTVRVTGGGIVHLRAGGTSEGGLLVGGAELRLDGLAEFGVSLASGGRLSGSGTVDVQLSADYSPGVVVAPGPGVARITTDGLDLGAFGIGGGDAVLELDLNGLEPGISYDQIRARASVFIRRLGFDLSVGYPAQFGDAFRVIDNVSNASTFAAFPSLPEGSTFISDGYAFRITYRGGTGNDVVLTVVPEPASAVALGAIGVGLIRRRRRCATTG